MTIQLFQTTRDFYISRVAYSACIMFSETVMSKCLPLSQLTNTVLIFLLCQHQSLSLSSNGITVSQQKTQAGVWASILTVQLLFFFFTMEMTYILLLSLVYCNTRRMYGTFLCIPYGNILPVYYSISSHTFYFLCPSGGELPYTVLRNLKTQFDLDILCSNSKLIFHLIVISGSDTRSPFSFPVKIQWIKLMKSNIIILITDFCSPWWKINFSLIIKSGKLRIFKYAFDRSKPERFSKQCGQGKAMLKTIE